MPKIFILVFVLLIISCTNTKKEVDVVYPTISNEQKKKIEKQTSIPVVKESAIDLSEGSAVVLYKKPVSLEEQNRSLNWKLYQKEKEVENLKKIMAVSENDTQKNVGSETINSSLNTTSSKQIKASIVSTIAPSEKVLSAPPLATEQVVSDVTEQVMDEELVFEKEPVFEQSISTEKKAPEVVSEKIVLPNDLPTEKKYHLRIISLPMHSIYERSVENIVLFLQTESIKATYYALGKYWVVDVVDVPPYRSQQSIEFQEKIKKLKYQGSFQFKDAYYTAGRETSQK